MVNSGGSLRTIQRAMPPKRIHRLDQAVDLARVMDRTGKGLRGSARDALIAGSIEKEHWGKAFGFHRAMDTLGAALGPLAALALLRAMPANAPRWANRSWTFNVS